MKALAPWGVSAAALLTAVIVLAGLPPAAFRAPPPVAVAAGPYDCQGNAYTTLSGPEAVTNGGFESGLSGWGTGANPLTISTAVVHSGNASAKVDAVTYESTNTYQYLPPLTSVYLASHWFYVDAWGPGDHFGVDIMRYWDPSTGAGDHIIAVRIRPSDIEFDSWLVHGVSGTHQVIPFNLTSGAWHSLAVVADAGRGVQCLFVDDVRIAASTVNASLTFLPSVLILGDLTWGGDAGTGYYDDLSILPATTSTGDRPPVAHAGGPYTALEGTLIAFDASASSDPDGDNLTFRWDFQDDGTWDTGWSLDPTAAYTWGDDWVGIARLEVSDGQATDNATADVTVSNSPPAVLDAQAYAVADATLRVAGEKFHDVRMDLVWEGNVTGSVRVVRMPGSPDRQSGTIEGAHLQLLGGFAIILTYSPGDDKVNGQPNGANPAWVTLTFPDGSKVRLHHAFNVMHPQTWVWTIDDLRPYFVGKTITFNGTAHDVGSDDLTFTWSFGDGSPDATTITYNNGIGPDPYPSPEVNPITATDAHDHAFTMAGTYTVTLTVTDDDGGVAAMTFTIDVGG